MLKVLIADDEVKVVQLIEYLVDWNSFGMEIIDRVNDGRRALDVILSKEPDVVITDIRMPVINGIELVEKTQEAGLNPFFIIISGYSEFEYAQRAIQMGVEDYLLKPLKKKDLETVLLKISEKYRQSQETEDEKKELVERLSQSMKKAKGNLLTDVIVRRSNAPYTMSAPEFIEEYGFSLGGSYMECLVIHIFTGLPHDRQANEEEYHFLLPKIQDVVESRLSPICTEVISTIYNDALICLINHNEEDRAPILEELQKMKINVLNYRNIYPDLRIAVGMSKPITSLRLLPEGYQDARNALIKRFVHEDAFVLISDDYFHPESGDARLITPQDRKNLLSRLELLDIDGTEKMLEQLLDKILACADSPQRVITACDSLAETLIFGFQSFDDISPDIVNMTEGLGRAPYCLYTGEQLKTYYTETCGNILRSYSAARKSMEDKPIRQAKQYIQEHYSEAISLELVSGEVGFNPAYFSTVFKKSTGQNFMDYVKEIRIQNAKEMLIHTNMDIAQIAQAVGYSDIKYFSKLFRKLTELTPSDYRKLYG